MDLRERKREKGRVWQRERERERERESERERERERESACERESEREREKEKCVCTYACGVRTSTWTRNSQEVFALLTKLLSCAYNKIAIFSEKDPRVRCRERKRFTSRW